MALRGRPAKPTQILKLHGTYEPGRHGGRGEPEAEGDLASKPAPEWMTSAQRELWTEILVDAPRDLLRRIDWGIFANYIELVDRHAQAILAQRALDRGQAMPFLVKGKNGPIVSPYIRVINHCVLLMVRLQGEMGFTPSARARFRSTDKEPEDEAGGWALLNSLRVVEGGSEGLTKAERIVAPAIKYPREVSQGRIPAGRWVKLACKRFLADYEAAQQPDSEFVFDPARAATPIVFAELMVNVKGPRTGHAIELLPYEKWILATLFGFVERATGRRRYRQASIWVPKGNGKTTLAAVLALAVTFTEGEGGAEGYSAAVSRQQASIAFDLARAMAEKNPDFRRRYKVQVNANTISQAATGSSLRALSGHAKALDGLNVHFAVLDEIGSHRSSGVYDTLITATGKRHQPLLISISTATDNATGVGRQIWNYTQQVLGGVLRDERFFGVIYDADANDDPWLETTWRKANPGWGILVQPDAIRALARQALASPALQAAFKTRHLNIWVSANNALFDMLAWTACTDPELTLDDFRGELCFAGIDMASRSDIAAGILIFPRFNEETGKTEYAIFSRAWLPETAVDTDRNPLYVQWAEAGALSVTAGETTDFQEIEDWFRDTGHEFDLRLCGYDPYDLRQFSQRLRNDGYPMEEYRSSTLNYSEPTKLLDAMMRDRRIRHNGDPVLAWCISNVVGHYDARSNVYPRRESPDKKIDCAIATIIALGVSIASEKDEGGYIYTDTSLLVF